MLELDTAGSAFILYPRPNYYSHNIARKPLDGRKFTEGFISRGFVLAIFFVDIIKTDINWQMAMRRRNNYEIPFARHQPLTCERGDARWNACISMIKVKLLFESPDDTEFRKGYNVPPPSPGWRNLGSHWGLTRCRLRNVRRSPFVRKAYVKAAILRMGDVTARDRQWTCRRFFRNTEV